MSAESPNYRIPYPTSSDKVHELPSLLKTLASKIDSEIQELYKAVNSKSTPPPAAAPDPKVEQMWLGGGVEALKSGKVVSIRNNTGRRVGNLKSLPPDWCPKKNTYLIAPNVSGATINDMAWVKIDSWGMVDFNTGFNGTVTFIADGT